MKKTNHEMHHRVNDQSSQPGFKRTVMRFSAETRIRAQGSRRGFRAAAAAVAAAFLMTGCGTTPPPEPQGERIWVNFPAFETKQKDLAAPITDRNVVGSRVVVRKVETEVLVPRELEALRAGERSETDGIEPDLRMRPDQPVPTPPVAAASKSGEANAATETKPLADGPHAAVPAGKENERNEANGAMPASTLKSVLKPALTSVTSMGAESAGAAVSDESSSSSSSSSSASSALRPTKTVPSETDSGVRGGQATAAASATTSTSTSTSSSTSISISISAGSAAAEKEAADSRALSSPSSPAFPTASDAAVRAESVDPGATPTSAPDTKPVKEEKTHEEKEENEEKASEKDVVKKDDVKETASEAKIGGGDAILGGTALPSRETAEDISTDPSGVSVPLGRLDLQEESAPSVQFDSARQPKEDSEPEKQTAEGTN